MANHHVVVVLCILIVIGIVRPANAASKCGEDTLEEVDRLVGTILPFNDPKVKPPEKVQDIGKFCNFYTGVLDQIERINKGCARSEYRNLISLVTYNIRKNIDRLCSKKALADRSVSPEKQKFLEISRCINSGNKKIEKCAIASRGHVVAMQNAEKSKKVPLLCCEFIAIRKCIINALNHEKGCTGGEKRETMENFIKNLSRNAFNVACSNVEDEAKCESLKIPKRKRGQKIPRSFMVPVLRLIETI